MSRIASRRKRAPVVSRTGVEVSECYCRRCRQTKPARDFYQAVDIEIDTNGFMSVCSACIGELFDSALSVEGSIEVAILKLCRKLNLKYSPEAIESAKAQVDTLREAGKVIPNFFSIYKIKLTSTSKGQFGQRDEDLTYQEVTNITIAEDGTNTLENFDENELDMDVIEFWGQGLETKQYEWLEKKMGRYKKTYSCATEAEESLLRLIVLKELEIELTRMDNKSTSSLIKDLKMLMETASIDPAKLAASASGKVETFSSFIKTIEENRPAEYYEDKKLFYDFDNIAYYFDKYVTRPLKNFITQSRDFSLEAENDDDEFEDSEIDTSVGEETESEV